MPRILTIAAALIAVASATNAAELVSERYVIEVEAGAVLRQDLSCPREQLISGGVGLNEVVGGPPGSAMLTASTFADKGTWRVEFLNLHDAALSVDFAITVFCD